MGITLLQSDLDALFPADIADKFFEALYGDAEDGAYDIRLVFRSGDAKALELAFELHQREGKCLVCNLTYGLPQVFQRHPIINMAALAPRIAALAGWKGQTTHFSLGRTEENSRSLHCIPLTITPA
ncbi:MAG: hypothetical protein RRY29_00360 [Desulfovibrionaceae bacterium]